MSRRVFTFALLATLVLSLPLSVPLMAASPATDASAEPDWLAGQELGPTWADGMGLIVEHRCVSCHRPGGVAPMSFLTFSETRRWAKQIRVTTSTGTMPPWPADLGVGSFSNSHALTDRELELFAEWADGSFPKGDGDYQPTDKWQQEWKIGEPDAIFELPEVTLTEDDTEVVKELAVKTEFPEDRWITATEALPGDQWSVLHIDGGVLGSYYPGNSTERLPEGSAYLLKAGAEIDVKVWYRKESGQKIRDRSRLGVIFAPEPSSLTRQLISHPIVNTEFSIPAGASSHSVSARYELAKDAELVSLLPVMMDRGRSISYTARFPDGRERVLLSIPEWDPLWKYRYELSEPVPVPRGTVITAHATYDNSANNLRNPNPDVMVAAGPGGELLEGRIGLATPAVNVVADRADARRSPPVRLADFRLVHREINGSADSAISPDGKWFAFASRRAGNLDLWRIHTETARLERVTRHPSSDYEARWHPSGKQLAFVTHRNGSQDVYLKDLETGEETPIATESFNEDYPSFSKDGSEIVFTGGPGGYREVQVYNLESGETRTLTKGYGWVGSTNFSPDGGSIVFHAYYERSYLSGKSDIFRVPAQGGEVTNITNARDVWDYKAAWSYGSDWIAFSSKRSSPNFNLFLMRPDGSDLRQITRVADYDLRWANFTRDGRLGWHQVEPQEGVIRAVDVATGKLSDVVSSEDYINHLRGSPGGEALLYETDGKVFLLEAVPGAEAKELTRGLRPQWSRDGDRISFLRTRRNDDGVYETGIGNLPVSGAGPTAMAWLSPLTLGDSAQPWSEGSFDEAWSPDGQTLAKLEETGGKTRILLISTSGEQRTLLESDTSASSPVWSADGKAIFFVQNQSRSIGYYMTTESVTSKRGFASPTAGR